MSPSNRLVFALAAGCVAIAAISALQQRSPADQTPPPMQASVDDIGKNLILVGRLQKPLGTMMTVRGRWRIPDGVPKDASPRFTVSHVEGKRLDQPIEFHIAQLSVFTKRGASAIPPHDRQSDLDGVEWTLWAYEIGSVELYPEDFWKAVPPMPEPGFLAPPFSSKLVGLHQP